MSTTRPVCWKEEEREVYTVICTTRKTDLVIERESMREKGMGETFFLRPQFSYQNLNLSPPDLTLELSQKIVN